MGGPGQRLEPCRCDRLAAPDASTEGSVVEPPQSGINLGEVLQRSIAQGEVSLLFEHLAGCGSLGAIRHLVGCLDGLPDLFLQSGALGEQFAPERLGRSDIHPRERNASTGACAPLRQDYRLRGRTHLAGWGGSVGIGTVEP